MICRAETKSVGGAEALRRRYIGIDDLSHPPTKRQQQYIDAATRIESRGDVITMEGLCAEVGIAGVSSAHQMCRKLKRRGVLEQSTAGRYRISKTTLLEALRALDDDDALPATLRCFDAMWKSTP